MILLVTFVIDDKDNIGSTKNTEKGSNLVLGTSESTLLKTH